MEFDPPRYYDGRPVRAGDILEPGLDVDGQEIVVVYVVKTGESVGSFNPSAWAELESGVIVEHRISGVKHVVHYPQLDSDIRLLSRKPE